MLLPRVTRIPSLTFFYIARLSSAVARALGVASSDVSISRIQPGGDGRRRLRAEAWVFAVASIRFPSDSEEGAKAFVAGQDMTKLQADINTDFQTNANPSARIAIVEALAIAEELTPKEFLYKIH